nr:hypothetical protein [Tanacetum cinerariifolium]
MMVQQDLHPVVEIPLVIVDGNLVLHMVDRIVVVEEMLKTVDYTIVGCVRSAKVLSLVEAGVFRVGGTSIVPN